MPDAPLTLPAGEWNGRERNAAVATPVRGHFARLGEGL
jgi:hypothetical protein